MTALGFDVERLAARTYGDSGLGVPYDHLVLKGGPWLVDVGFGSHSLYPLRLDERGEQSDPAGSFRVEQTPDGDFDVSRDDEPQYRLWSRPQELRDFTTGCWWHRTSPESHFTRSLVCSLTTMDGRISLSGRRLIRTEAGQRHERELATEGARGIPRPLRNITRPGSGRPTAAHLAVARRAGQTLKFRRMRRGWRRRLVMTTLGLIGSGNIGGTVARLAAAADYDVVLSNSRDPSTLADLVAEIGPRASAGTPADAAAAGDLVLVSTPLRAIPHVPVALLAGKVVMVVRLRRRPV